MKPNKTKLLGHLSQSSHMPKTLIINDHFPRESYNKWRVSLKKQQRNKNVFPSKNREMWLGNNLLELWLMLQNLKQHVLTKQTVARQRHRCSVCSVSHTVLFALPSEYCIYFHLQKHVAALSIECALEFIQCTWAAKRLEHGLMWIRRPRRDLMTPRCVNLEMGGEKRAAPANTKTDVCYYSGDK